MARFDVYPMPGRGQAGYVVDAQAALLDRLATRIVAPLLPPGDAPPPISDLNPVFEIADQPFMLTTQALAAIPRRERARAVASLADQQDRIIRAWISC